jgi:hypothetical protein
MALRGQDTTPYDYDPSRLEQTDDDGSGSVFKCSGCGEQCYHTNFNRHKSGEAHRKKMAEQGYRLRPVVTHLCPMCPQTFRRKDLLRRHEKKHNSKRAQEKRATEPQSNYPRPSSNPNPSFSGSKFSSLPIDVLSTGTSPEYSSPQYQSELGMNNYAPLMPATKEDSFTLGLYTASSAGYHPSLLLADTDTCEIPICIVQSPSNDQALTFSPSDSGSSFSPSPLITSGFPSPLYGSTNESLSPWSPWTRSIPSPSSRFSLSPLPLADQPDFPDVFASSPQSPSNVLRSVSPIASPLPPSGKAPVPAPSQLQEGHQYRLGATYHSDGSLRCIERCADTDEIRQALEMFEEFKRMGIYPRPAT